MASAVDASLRGANVASVSKGTKIEIDFTKLQERYGIKPDDVGVADWGRDKNLPAVKVEDLLRCSLDLEHCKFKEQPPISFTFRTAVQYVVDTINRSKEYTIPLGSFPGSIHHDLIVALTNIDTPKPNLVPEAPLYEAPTCSAPRGCGRHWLGAISRMLLDDGHISQYGMKNDWWIQR